MRKYLLFIIIGCCLMVKAEAFGIKDVIILSKSGVNDDVIIAIINNAVIGDDLTVEKIIALHRQGVSQKVLVALVNKLARQTTEREAQPPQRELSPFDQFFLSTYYSHQYGWPAPNYDSPKEILERGLYYSPPDRYPNASRVRIYGHHYSVDPRFPWREGTWSPYSIIVPRSSIPNKKKHFHNPAKLQAMLQALTKLQRRQNAVKQQAVTTHGEKPTAKATATPEMIKTASPLLGDWYEKLVSLAKEINQHNGLDIQEYYGKISQYQIWMLRLQHRISKQQRRGKNLSTWLKRCRQTARYQKQQHAIAQLNYLATNRPLPLDISEQIARLQSCYQDCRRNPRPEMLPVRQAQIVENLQKIQRKFTAIFRQLDILLFEFELE